MMHAQRSTHRGLMTSTVAERAPCRQCILGLSPLLKCRRSHRAQDSELGADKIIHKPFCVLYDVLTSVDFKGGRTL